MNLNKKVVESMTVVSTLFVMTTITALGGSTEDSTGDVTRSVALGKNGTAGIMTELRDVQIVPLGNGDEMIASVEKTHKDIVSESGDEPDLEARSACGIAELGEIVAEEALQTKEAATETAAEEELPAMENAEEPAVEEISSLAEEVLAEQMEEETVAKAQQSEEAVTEAEQSEKAAAAMQQTEEIELNTSETEESEWANLVMANVQEDMNIRTAPDENSELAGKFYRGDVAEVISVEGEWTQITSGNATGYVKNEYLVYGSEASDLANEVCSLYATVEADGLRLRSEPNEAAGVVTTAANGDRLKVDKEAETEDGWVAVYTASSTAYVSADYVNVELNLGTALNSEEVAAKEAREAEAARAAEAAKSAGTKKAAVAASTDEVSLLGALIQCEAGGGSYEGMVAVGAVVMNRVRSGGYPGSISGVIYQGGQFTPALNGSVARVLASGVRGACLSAAQEAINGRDNTNGALSFRGASSGAQGTVIGGNVFF